MDGWRRAGLDDAFLIKQALPLEISYLGMAGLDTPIWDVLALQGEEERALNRLRTCSRCLSFPIRQVVPVGPPRARFFSWARWARFFIAKKSVYW
jgi:hypothetical protein